MEDVRSAQLPSDKSGNALLLAQEACLGYTDPVAGCGHLKWPLLAACSSGILALPLYMLSAGLVSVANAEMLSIESGIAH
jgi:hypothetical protein